MEIRFDKNLEKAVLIILKILGVFMLRELGMITPYGWKYGLTTLLENLTRLEIEEGEEKDN